MVPSAAEFHDIINGRRRGLRDALWRTAFAVAEPAYRWGVWRRNRKFDRGKREICTVEAPVVSVGNLTLGGTGKTPMVEWIARWFRERGVRVCIVSRGYGAEEGGLNDEALELEEKLPDVPHLQNPNRVAGAETAIEELAAQLILLDDGFQHRRLHRDLDIVLIDAAAPFGNGRWFPRGVLREGPSSLRRADVVILTRADMASEAEKTTLRQRVQRWAPDAVWAEAVHQPVALRTGLGNEKSLDEFKGKQVAAFCGIGNPQAFRRTLEQLGYEVAAFHAFDDHHLYMLDDAKWLTYWAADMRGQAVAVVCTHKDLVKVQLPELGGLPLYAIRIGIEFLTGRSELEAKLQMLI